MIAASRRVVLLSLMSLLALVAGPAAAVDLLLVNGRVWTGDDSRPWADSIAVDHGRIVAVGAYSEVRRYRALP